MISKTGFGLKNDQKLVFENNFTMLYFLIFKNGVTRINLIETNLHFDLLSNYTFHQSRSEI
jgi:hypothetical protein